MARTSDLMAEHGFVIHRDVEQIEVTYSGLFGGEPDHARRFIPGASHYTIEAADGRRWYVGEDPGPSPAVEWFADYMERHEPDVRPAQVG